MGPVILIDNGRLTLTLSEYGLIPSWSKERKLKFSTHNARIETITTKPTWRKPLLRHHCLVALTEFREAVRTGPLANHIIAFKPKTGDLLLAAGIYDIWHGPEQAVHSFAMITTEASQPVLDYSHHREPLFLDAQAGLAWLDNNASLQNGAVDFLLAARKSNEYTVEPIRKLKNTTK